MQLSVLQPPQIVSNEVAVKPPLTCWLLDDPAHPQHSLGAVGGAGRRVAVSASDRGTAATDAAATGATATGAAAGSSAILWSSDLSIIGTWPVTAAGCLVQSPSSLAAAWHYNCLSPPAAQTWALLLARQPIAAGPEPFGDWGNTLLKRVADLFQASQATGVTMGEVNGTA